MAIFGDFIWSENQLLNHISAPNLTRLENFVWLSNGTLESRRGFEPIPYFVGSTSSSASGVPGVQCVIEMTDANGNPYIFSSAETYSMGAAGTDNFLLYGDSFYFTHPNGSGFSVIPFALNTSGTSQRYTYYSTDASTNSTFVEGNDKCTIINYSGKIVFTSGNGSFQIIQNGIGTSSSNYTRLDNTILPITNQSIIGMVRFQQRLTCITKEGYLIYSPVDWDGVTGWSANPSNLGGFIQITSDPGELLETITVTKGGIVISSRNSAKEYGNIYNILTLDSTSANFGVLNTSQNAYFSKGALIAYGQDITGLTPMGLLSVGVQELTNQAIVKSESSAISELLSSIFKDKSIYPVLDAFLDTTAKGSYFIINNRLDPDNTISKLLYYQYDTKKWSQLSTKLPIQRMFMYYGYPAAAGYIVDPSTGKMYLGVWSLSYTYKDTKIDIKETATVDGRSVTFWDYSETKIPYRKYFVTGNVNLTGDSRRDGDAKTVIQNIMTSGDDEFKYRCGYFQTSNNTNTGVVSLEANSDIGAKLNTLTKWSDYVTQAIWGTTLKYYPKYEQATVNLRGSGSVFYQVWFESYSDTKIKLIDYRGDSTP